VAAVLAGALVLAACGGDDDPESATTTTDRQTTTTIDQAKADEEAVRKVAEEWAEASVRLLKEPNPADPALERFLAGEMLDRFREDIARRDREGLISRSPERPRTSHRIDAVVVKNDEATLRECFVDDLVLTKRATGEVLNDEVATYETRTTARRSSNGWKLVKRDGTRMEGVTGCAEA